jgi:hypothetical protein
VKLVLVIPIKSADTNVGNLLKLSETEKPTMLSETGRRDKNK